MFSKANGKRLYEEVVTQIKYLINTQQLKHGDMLPSEEDLSKSIGVSRTTVREGLRILELMGLVETKRGKGTFITVNDQESIKKMVGHNLGSLARDLLSVHELDKLLEPSVVKLVAQKATDEDIQRIKRALDKAEESIKNGETGEAETLYFHKCIIEVLNNPILNSIFELTREIHERGRKVLCISPAQSSQALKDHYRIFNAIQTHNGNKAYLYMEKHLETVETSLNHVLGLSDRNNGETR